MFGKCIKCELMAEKCVSLSSEIVYLRQQTKDLTDRLLAIASPQAYQAVHYSPLSGDECYGSDSDEMIEYGPNGQRVIMTKKRPE